MRYILIVFDFLLLMAKSSIFFSKVYLVWWRYLLDPVLLTGLYYTIWFLWIINIQMG